MTCCQATDEFFDSRFVSRELKRYHRSGGLRSTKKLISALLEKGVKGCTLLDIGGGVGAIQHALFESGITSAVCVDASMEYLRAAQQEALWRGNRSRTSMYHGDFVDLAKRIEKADIVTLDRVLCCYANLEQLVCASVGKARRLYGLVYPRGTLLSRVGIVTFNVFSWMMRKKFRTYYHRPNQIRQLVTSSGFAEVSQKNTLIWHIVVYERQ